MKPFVSLSKHSVDPDLSGRLIRLFRLTPFALLLTVLFLSPLLLCSPADVHAQWGPEIRLTYDPNHSSTSYNNARCVAAEGDMIHVVWFDNRTGLAEVYYKRSTDGGVSWSEDILLSDLGGVPSNFPSVAVSGPYVHVVWSENCESDLKVGYIRSTNYGGSWGDPYVIADPPLGWSYYPSVAVSGMNVHVVWQEILDWVHWSVYYKRNTNYGDPFDWGGDVVLSSCLENHRSEFPSVAASPPFVHVAWDETRDLSNYRVYYKRSTNDGANWDVEEFPLSNFHSGARPIHVEVSEQPFVHIFWHNLETLYYVKSRRSTNNGDQWSWEGERRLSDPDVSSTYPSAAASGSDVHLVMERGVQFGQIFYRHSPDNGLNWDDEDAQVTYLPACPDLPSVAASNSQIHLVWRDGRVNTISMEIYYKRNPAGSGYFGFKTDSSNGRHLVRDPSRGHLHMVMTGQYGEVFYGRSSDDGLTWPHLQQLSYWYGGKNPTIGLAMLPQDVYPPYLAVCVAYASEDGAHLLYRWNDGYDDPGMGNWSSIIYLGSNVNPGSPSLVTVGQQNYIAYRSGGQLVCKNFGYDGSGGTVETIDSDASASQPSLGVDGNGYLYAAWRRATNNGEIWFAPHDDTPPYWSEKEQIDRTGDLSQQPFIECYGDHAYVAWSDGEESPSDVLRADKQLGGNWQYSFPSSSPGVASESPTQAGSEFTTWAEGTGGGMFDNYYWRASNTERNPVLSNPTTWSYWPHSQMWNGWFWDTHLVSAWTESPNANNPPYTVLTHHLYWGFGGGGGGGFLSEPSGDKGAYYKVVTGLDSLSPYCKKRDGVLRFGDKSVDYARDSLIYELPYLDPIHDYLVKVSSYRETGTNWAQALSVNGKTVRSVQFAPNKVDTAWFKIPPSAYAKNRKVVFSLRNVKGDYVTSFGLTLYQRDPRRGKGGPQIGDPMTLPVREVFAVYPNPMKSQALIEYSLTSPGKVDLSVYDVTGGLVKRVVDAPQPAGVHKVTWDGCDQAGRRASSGIYFVHLTSPGKVKTTRVVVVR